VTAFATEAELVGALRKELSSLFPDATVITDEVPSGYGVADVVLAEPALASFAARISSALEQLRGRAAAEALLVRHWEVRNPRTGGGPVPSKRILRLLEAHGFLAGADAAVVVEPAFARIVAIEAKLTHWRRALEQAVRYQCYADQAFVALPYGRARSIPHEPFLLAGVGLLGVDASGCVVLVTPSQSEQIEPWRRLLVSEELVERVRKGRRLAKPESPETDYPAAEPRRPARAVLAH
jgi:hypothetical protein